MTITDWALVDTSTTRKNMGLEIMAASLGAIVIFAFIFLAGFVLWML